MPTATNTSALDLRPPRNRVSRKALGYWTVRALLGWLAIAAVQVPWLIGTESPAPHVAGLAATVVLAAAHLLVMPRWRFRVHLWEATPEAIYTQSGWFNQERRVAPVSRIQTVDSKRGPLEQLFGLANVTVTTASAAGPIKIDGLAAGTARELVEELTATTQASPGDAT